VRFEEHIALNSQRLNIKLFQQMRIIICAMMAMELGIFWFLKNALVCVKNIILCNLFGKT